MGPTRMGLLDQLKQRGTSLSHEQKAAFVLLMFLGLGGVVLGFLSFGANIRRPFEIQIARYTGDTYLTSSQKEAKEEEAMKTTDTDKDGLMDYDERYVFKTSPYLTDTDSDGVDDRAEVFAGSDPNCPRGKDCGRSIASADAASGTSADPNALLGTIPDSPFSQGLADVNLSSTDDLMTFFNSLSTDQIRQALEESGVPKETLDAMDDDTVRQVFNDAVSQASDSGQFAALVNQLKAQAGVTDETTTDTTDASGTTSDTTTTSP